MKLKIITIALAGVLAIALAISVGMNINRHIKEQERLDNLKSMLFVALSNTESYLNRSLHYNELGNKNQAFIDLSYALTAMHRADNLLRSAGINFSLNNHNISLGSMSVNILSRIMEDGIISETEVVFLTRLKHDMSIVVEQLSAPDVGDMVFGVDRSLSLDEIRDILYEFVIKWTDGTREDSPWLLLQ